MLDLAFNSSSGAWKNLRESCVLPIKKEGISRKWMSIATWRI